MAWENPLIPQIKALIALDQIDLAIMRINQERSEIREMVKNAKAEIESFHSGLAEIEAAERECAALQKTDEEELRRIEKKLKRVGDYSHVTSAKEYDATKKEIEALKIRKDELEDEILGCMERAEEMEERRIEFQRKIIGRKKYINEEYEAWQKRYNALGDDLEGHKQDRDVIIPQFDVELRSTYLRLMQRYGDRSVVHVVEDRCSSCLLHVPAQHVVDLLMGRAVHTCQHCGRFVLPDDLKYDEE